MQTFVISLLKKTSDLFFPPIPACVFCGKELQVGDVCDACKKENEGYTLKDPVQYLDFECYSPFSYQGKIPRVVQRFKFEDARYLAPFMAAQIAALIKPDSFDIITCVPLHKSRKSFRGYNQAQMLAQALSQQMQMPFVPILRRDRKTLPQTSLGREERQKNVQGAFALELGAEVKNKRILLVDDVVTVGATMQACTKVLFANGAAKVMGASFAATLV